MTADSLVVPGLLLLALELLALACVGYLVARVALRQGAEGMALAQGLVIGPALWGLIVSFVLYLLPGMAGAIAGWIIVVVLGAGLAWRAPQALRVPLRSIAGFGLAGTAIFWVALAGRQLFTIPDPEINLGLAAAFRAGVWPPVLPWNPWMPVYYHFGVDLLVGLLAPPFGPDLGLVMEILGAYAWTALVLVAATLLWRYGWIGVLVLPLLLTAGASALIGYTPDNILQMPVPTGIPEAGLRTSFADIYWPAIGPDQLPFTSQAQVAPPNIWKPPFVLAYALTFVVLAWAATSRHRSWPAVVTISALIGFMGIIEEAVALTTLALWVLLEAWRLVQAWRKRSVDRAMLLRLAAGPALAALLLVAGGGVITGNRGWILWDGRTACDWVDRRPGEPAPPGAPGSAFRRHGPFGDWSVRRRYRRRAAGATKSARSVAGGGERRVPAGRAHPAIRARARCDPAGRARSEFRPSRAAARTQQPSARAATTLALHSGRVLRGAGYLADCCGTDAQHWPGTHLRAQV